MAVPKQYENDLVLRAFNGETTPRTPVWLMRQAGRTDPEYLALRERLGLPLEELFRHPEHAATITLLPKRLGVDALIIYQDILTPLSPMGAHFLFRPGPKLEAPIENVQALEALHTYEVPKHTGFFGETFARLHETLQGEMPVLGFAGAPLTMAVFVLEGKSFGESAPRALRWLYEEPEAVHRFLDKLTEMTIDYLKFQIESGAAAVQLFESAAFLLSETEYRQFALPYQQRVFEALRGTVPTIIFARDWLNMQELNDAGATAVSLPAGISIAEARETLGADKPIQGNVDNRLVRSGPPEAITQAVEDCICSGQHHAHVFNLSHGLLRDTPYEHVQHTVRTAREFRV